MALRWIREAPPMWDAGKQRVLGAAPEGALPPYERVPGGLAPGDWWRVEADGQTVGYGWMDVVWGDAEILLAVSPEAQGTGVGSYILEQLEQEARMRGLNRIYNSVRRTHPARQQVMAWLGRRGFAGNGDHEQLVRTVHARRD